MTRMCTAEGCDQPARERAVPWGPHPKTCAAHEHPSNRRRQAGEPPEKRQETFAHCAPSGRRCEAPGCDTPTNGNKPYCTDHVELMPYVQELLGRRKRRYVDAPTDGQTEAPGEIPDEGCRRYVRGCLCPRCTWKRADMRARSAAKRATTRSPEAA